MVRTYWFFPGFYEASGNLDLQPFARIDQIEAKSPPCYVGTNSTRDGQAARKAARVQSSRLDRCLTPGSQTRMRAAISPAPAAPGCSRGWRLGFAASPATSI